MADRKITELTNITGANLADGDEFVVVDASADETKALTFAELKAGLDTATGFVRITGDTMTGALTTTKLGIGSAPSTGYAVDVTGLSGYDDVMRLTAVGTNIGARINLTNTGTGVARINATNNSLALQTGGTNAIVIDSSQNVGVNTTTPTTLGGGANFTVNQGADGNIVFARGGSTRQIQLGTTSTTAYINEDNASGGLAFHINGAEKGRINNSGHYLIGTTDAGIYDDASDEAGHNLLANGQYYNSAVNEINMILNRQNGDGDILQIRKDGAMVGSIGSNTSGGQPLLDINAKTSGNSQMRFTTSGNEAMRISSDGAIIIGGTSANTGSATTFHQDGTWRNVLASGNGGDSFMSAISGVSNGYQISVDSSNNQTYKWHTASTQAMTLTSAGRLGLGETSPDGKLHITSTGTAGAPVLTIENTSSSTFNHVQENLAPNLAAGENAILVIGKAGSTKNSGYIGYKYSSAGSNDNILTFGHWASDNLVNITGDGKVGIGTTSPAKELDVSGTITADQYDNDEALPNVRPSLLLDFANSKTLDPRITFTRGSTATYWDGKTKTKAEENLHLHSQSTSDKSEFNFTFTNNNATAPDGTTTATLLTADSSGTGGPRYYGSSNTNGQRAFVSGETYTVSAYFKAGTTTYCYISMRTTSGNIAASEFNLSTGSASTATKVGSFSNPSSTMTSVGKGWYRCTLTATAGATTSDGYNFFGISDGTGIGGGGYPDLITLSGQTVYIWGLQKERNSAVTTYTATTSQAIVKYQPTLQTAASGEPRFDHDPVTGESKGLLIEKDRTNLHLTSESATNHIGLNAMDVISNDAIAPDGTKSADFVYPTIGTQRHEIQPRWSSTSGVTYAFSAYIKPVGTVTEVSLSHTGGTAITALFDLENGTVTNRGSQSGSYAQIEDAGNGWYRCILVGDATSSNSNYSMYISPSDGGETLGSGSTVFGSFAANGANGILIWGVQVEAGAFATSYIRTSGATVTRSGDRANMSLTGICESSPVSIYVEAAEAGDEDYARLVLLSDGTNDNRMQITISESSGYIQAYVEANDSVYTSLNRNFDPAYKTFFKAAAAFDLDNVAVTAGGLSVSTDTTALMPEVTNLYLGSLNDANADSGATFKKVALYPARLSDATLQAMTKD